MSVPAPLAVIVCGGRHYDNRAQVYRVLDELSPSAIIHGGATGADHLAHLWATYAGVPVEEVPADWQEHGRSAGPIRNKQMAELLDRARRKGARTLVVAFPGGAGTKNMCSIAKQMGLEIVKVKDAKEAV